MQLFKSVIILCLAVSTSVAIAQDRPRRSPEERAENQTHWMQKNLGLSQDQNKKVYDIILFYAREAENAAAEPRGNEKKIEKNGIKKDRESELKEVLTPDQFSKYKMHMQEMKEKQMERRQNRF